MIKKQKTRINADVNHGIDAGKEKRTSWVTSTDADSVSAQRANLKEIWPLVLRLYRLRLLKSHLRGGKLAKVDLKIKSPIQAALLALMMEVEERRSSSPAAEDKKSNVHDPLSKDLAFALDMATTQISEHMGALLKARLCTEEKCIDDRRHAHYLVTEEGRREFDKWLEREMVLIPAHYQSGYREPKERVKYAIDLLNEEVGTLLKAYDLLGG
jgi:DNA-binding MarR family transcriptional regulator